MLSHLWMDLDETLDGLGSKAGQVKDTLFNKGSQAQGTLSYLLSSSSQNVNEFTH